MEHVAHYGAQSAAQPNQEQTVTKGGRSVCSTWREWIAAAAGALCSLFNVLHIADIASDRIQMPGGSGETLSGAAKGVGYASSSIGVLVGPYAIYNETQLAKEGTLREAMAGLRDEVNRFHEENEKLTLEINKLERSVGTLHEIEDALSELTKQQGSDMESFMSLVRENKRITETMKELLRARALEDVISLILRCDSNGNFQLEGNEIEELILGLKLIEDIEFDEDKFRQQVLEKGSVRFVLRTVKDLMRDEAREDAFVRMKDSSSCMDISSASFLASIRMGVVTSSSADKFGVIEEECTQCAK